MKAERANVDFTQAAEAARGALDQLEIEGIRVLAQIWNGVRMTIVVNRAPRGVAGVTKRWHPTALGIARTHAAPWHGVQIEWLTESVRSMEVGHA